MQYNDSINRDSVIAIVLHWAMAVLIATICLLPEVAMALAANWNIVPEKSKIYFIATQNGAPVTGKFNDFKGQINFDPDHLSESKARIIVDVNSISTSYQDLTDALKTADWFDMKLFPEAVFNSSTFTKAGDNQYQAKGTLTIRDQTVPVTLTFTFQQPTADTALVKGTTYLKRTDFGVGQGEWSSVNEIQNDVKVNFIVNAVKKSPKP